MPIHKPGNYSCRYFSGLHEDVFSSILRRHLWPTLPLHSIFVSLFLFFLPFFHFLFFFFSLPPPTSSHVASLSHNTTPAPSIPVMVFDDTNSDNGKAAAAAVSTESSSSNRKSTVGDPVEEKLGKYVAERAEAKEGVQRKVAGFGAILSPFGKYEHKHEHKHGHEHKHEHKHAYDLFPCYGPSNVVLGIICGVTKCLLLFLPSALPHQTLQRASTLP